MYATPEFSRYPSVITRPAFKNYDLMSLSNPDPAMENTTANRRRIPDSTERSVHESPGMQPTLRHAVYPSFAALGARFEAMFSRAEKIAFFLGRRWVENFTATVSHSDDKIGRAHV